MAAKDFATVYHSFFNGLKDDTRVFKTGTVTRAVGHYCINDRQKIQRSVGLGAYFFGDNFSAENNFVTINLEQPVAAGPRSGYCPYCNILWVAEDP